MMVVVVFVAVVEDVAVGRVVPRTREYGVHESGRDEEEEKDRVQGRVGMG